MRLYFWVLLKLMLMNLWFYKLLKLSYLLLCALNECRVLGVYPKIARIYFWTDDGRMNLFKTIFMIEFVNTMSLSLLKIASMFGERMVVKVIRSNGVGVSNNVSKVQINSNMDSNILSLIWYMEMFVLLFVLDSALFGCAYTQ